MVWRAKESVIQLNKIRLGEIWEFLSFFLFPKLLGLLHCEVEEFWTTGPSSLIIQSSTCITYVDLTWYDVDMVFI